jgi:lysophospholipase L1-like esterase
MQGASVTACGRDPDSPADLGAGYVAIVDGLLAASYPSHHIQVVNRGVDGNTVRELAARWRTDVLDLSPDWLSICIGINDVWQHFDGNEARLSHVTLTEYENTLEELLSSTRPVLEGLVLLTPYFIAPQSEPMRAMMDAYGLAVHRLAARHDARLVDAQAVFDDALEDAALESLSTDRVHLSVRGHTLLARAVLNAIDFDWGEA